MPEEDGLIAAHYRIDASRPAPALAGGLRAFTVTDRRDPSQPLLAIEMRSDLPARPRITLARSGPGVPHTVLPIEYGSGRDPLGRPGWYGVCDALPGKPVGVGRQAWREGDLLTYVLQPAAACLLALQSLGLTHRAINPDNLFRAGPRDAVTLGPFWASPPASLQPAVYEPPYMARCLPNGRGDGSIADDVYALGATMLALALGRVPLAELDDAEILRRKIEHGTYAALSENTILTPLLSDLLRGMLAEDPAHRPSPALLLKPEQARARRVAARPPRRAQQSFDLGGYTVWSAREMALGLSLRPDRGHAALRSGEVERWLRRCLGDPQLGMQLEEVTRRAADLGPEDARSQSLTVMSSIAALDPLAPLVWRGLAVQPDGLGSAFAGAAPDVTASLTEIVLSDAVAHFWVARGSKPALAAVKDEQRECRAWLTARGPAGGLKRLIYAMNPMLPCGSPLLTGRLVVRMADLLPALNAAASSTDRSKPPIDAHIASFIAARTESAISGGLCQLASFAGASDRLAILRLFGGLQARLQPGALPGLAGWLVASGFAALDDWQSRKTRADLLQRVTEAAQQGEINTLLELIDDEPARRADRDGAAAAQARADFLEQILAGMEDEAPKRHEAAQQMSHEIATGGGLIATLGAALAMALT